MQDRTALIETLRQSPAGPAVVQLLLSFQADLVNEWSAGEGNPEADTLNKGGHRVLAAIIHALTRAPAASVSRDDTLNT